MAPSTSEADPVADKDTQPTAASATFMKKNRNRGNIRKRPQEEDIVAEAKPASDPAPDEVAAPAAQRKAKLPKTDAPMAFTTRRAGDDRAAPFQFSSSRTLQQTTDQGATAALETETEFDRDARCGTKPR